MQGRPLILCCWPGLARLWLCGHWSSLFVAIGFALLLNLALVSSFVWPALLGPTFPQIAWPLVALVWAGSAWLSFRMFGSEPSKPLDGRHQEAPQTLDTLFNQAQNEYLKGDWKRAENLLSEQLRSNSRDIEARLMLATIFRRTGRLEKAVEQLNQLGRLDASVPWEFEINCERQLIEQTRDEIQADRQERSESDDDPPMVSEIPEPEVSGTVRLGESSNSNQRLSPDPSTVDWPVDSTQRRTA